MTSETCCFALFLVLTIEEGYRKFAWKLAFGDDTIQVPLTLLQYEELLDWMELHFPYLFHACVKYPWSWFVKKQLRRQQKEQRQQRMVHRRVMLPLLKERYSYLGTPFTFATPQ